MTIIKTTEFWKRFATVFSMVFLLTVACEGPEGPEGPQGVSTLSTISSEPAGANCENGGVRVDVGADSNGNGTLDASEITSSSFICNGADGVNSLVTVTSIGAGNRCENGGTRIESGLDTNGNGNLDDSEVTATAFVCNGINGNNSLVKVTTEAAGSNCANGGLKIESGVDDNGNGNLNNNEIDQTEYVCNGEDGEDGLTTLVTLEDEAAGVNCSAGGQKISTGLDEDRDGVLDSNEVSDVAYVCNAETTVDPTDADALSGVLGLTNAMSVSGNPPSPSTLSTAPDVTNNQSSARVSAGNTLFLPFTYSSTTSPGYSGCYVQVNGASTYFDLTDDEAATSGQIVLPVEIPDNVTTGTFTLEYCIYDANGLVSNILSTTVTVDDLQTCSSNTVSGNDGLSVFTYDLGGTAGSVDIQYNTFTVPDRIDVFYNRNWVGGSGSSLTFGDTPPVNNGCASGVDGYVGTGGFRTIQFNYDPSTSREVIIYMSGCIGGGTAWDLVVNCPQ